MSPLIDFESQYFHILLKEFLGCHKHGLAFAEHDLGKQVKLMLCDSNGKTRREDLKRFLQDSSDREGATALKKIFNDVIGTTGK